MTNVFYFGQAQTVGLTVFGIVAGVFMRITQRYKVRADLVSRRTLAYAPAQPLLVIGLCIRLL